MHENEQKRVAQKEAQNIPQVATVIRRIANGMVIVSLSKNQYKLISEAGKKSTYYCLIPNYFRL